MLVTCILRASLKKEHVRVHTGEKPYICKFCGRGFTQRTPLRTYEKTHLRDELACSVCGLSGTCVHRKLKQMTLIREEVPPCVICGSLMPCSHVPRLDRGYVNPCACPICGEVGPCMHLPIKLQEKSQGRGDISKCKPPTAKTRRPRKKKDPAKVPAKPKSTKPRKKRVHVAHPPPIKLEDPIHCDNCSDSYFSHVEFAFHSIKHSEDGKYTCHVCNSYRNAKKHSIEMHVRAHEGSTKYKCEICGKAFTINTYAIEHKYFHTGEKPFQCEICGKHFMFSRQLGSHRRTSHYEILTGSPLVKYDCDICKKHYESAFGLRRHKLTIHNDVDLSVICEICGKRISTKEKLKFHMRTHTGVKPYPCEICGKCFSKKHQMIEHTRVHTGEKPYICSHCGRGFSQRTPLVLHIRTHTGERPNLCRFCGNGFISKTALESHMKNCLPPFLVGGNLVSQLSQIPPLAPLSRLSQPSQLPQSPNLPQPAQSPQLARLPQSN
ncbi:unnamed protein product [Callosobruchus maculatus]|uniref:C2H2-type domain-containing protein n=1 Tax=Callosobruchus maculatus TaxID=64391 RepID=A0A653BU21_CALMS|nr:unnamed protein product [Callosobruchus maculatus]